MNLVDQQKEIIIYNQVNIPKRAKIKNVKKFLSQNSSSKPNIIPELIIPLNQNNINFFFCKRESELLFRREAEHFYSFNYFLENNFKIPKTFLDKHKINSSTRTLMVDWMIEVLSFFKNSDETLFLSVNIMDLFLSKSKNILKDENIHLLGITSMFIASKFQEIYPITLNDFVVKISFNEYNENEIIATEKKIIEEISPESLLIVSIYDFIKSSCYEFYYYHRKLLTDAEFEIFKNLEKTAVYLSKLILHYTCFSGEKSSIKAVACIFTAIKIIKTNFFLKFWNNNLDIIFNAWVVVIVSQNNFNLADIEKLGNSIYSAFKHYQKLSNISHSLNEFSSLDFLKEIDNKKD